MGESEAREEFWKGFALLRAGEARDALPHLRSSAKLDAHNALYLSYLGLATGLAEGNWDTAEDLCSQALRLERQQPNLYLNMAEVYRRAGKKDAAVSILEAGLEFSERNRSLRDALNRLGDRRPRVFTSLDRRHFLNRNLGQLRYHLLANRKEIV